MKTSIDVLIHTSEAHKDSSLFHKKLNTILYLLQEVNETVMDFLEKKKMKQNISIPPWEEEKLEKGDKQFEEGKRVSHKSVMDKANLILLN